MSPFSTYTVSLLKSAITSIDAAAVQEASFKNYEGAKILFDWCHNLHNLTENGTELSAPTSQPSELSVPSPTTRS